MNMTSHTVLARVMLCLSLSVPFTPAVAERAPIVQSLDIRNPVAPTPVTIAGKRYLAYELHMANFQRSDVALQGIQVRDTDTDKVLANHTGADLAARIVTAGNNPDSTTVKSGELSLVHFWIPLDDAATTPARLSHRLVFDTPGHAKPSIINDVIVEVRDAAMPVLNPPLRGGPWAAIYDPELSRGHRTSVYTINGRARVPARFAIDWIGLAKDGSRAKGDASLIENWHGYGAEVLAVADGVVVDARDDMTEAATLDGARGRMPLAAASGNYVVLDIGGGQFAFYEHLEHGSIRVAPGDKVRSGDVLGQLGNSGSSSSGPHLHFHVADSGEMLAGEGTPYVFSAFDVLGAYESIPAFRRGDAWQPAGVDDARSGKRENELPAANVVVMFPE